MKDKNKNEDNMELKVIFISTAINYITFPIKSTDSQIVSKYKIQAYDIQNSIHIKHTDKERLRMKE